MLRSGGPVPEPAAARSPAQVHSIDASAGTNLVDGTRSSKGRTLRWQARLSPIVAVDVGLAVGLLLVAAIFRLIAIDGQSLWLDEIGEATTARLPWDALFSSIRDDAAATPLDYLGVRLVTSAFGNGTVATRLWAVVVGCLAVLVVYAASRRLFASRGAGVLSALVLGTSPFAIFYGQEARFYSLTMLVAALSVLTFLRAWDDGGVKRWLTFSGVSALVLYTHYFAAGVLLASQTGFVVASSIGVWLGRGRSRLALEGVVRRGLWCAGAMLLAVALFIPWFLYATLPELGRTYGVAIPPPLDLSQIAIFLGEVSGGLVRSTAIVLAAAVLIAAGIGSLRAIVVRRAEVAILICAIVASIPVAWLADTRAQYYWTSRQIAFVVPLLAILAGGGLWALARIAARATHRSALAASGVAAVLGIAWVALSIPPIQRVYAGDISKDDWRGVTSLVASTACADAAFHVNIPAHYQFGIGYYDPVLATRSVYVPPGPEDLADAVREVPFGPHDWLIVLTYAPGVGSIDLLSSRMIQSGWTEHSFVAIRAFQRGGSCGP